LAREAGLLLAWDAAQRVYLWDVAGNPQGKTSVHFPLADAAISDDGSRVVLAGASGQLWWLNRELRLVIDLRLDSEPAAVALEPLGLYTAVSSRDRRTRLLSRTGREVVAFETPRPLAYLLFLHTRPLLVGAADFGFVGVFDTAGRCVWRQAPVTHVGSLCAGGMGETIFLASFFSGIERFDAAGRPLAAIPTSQPCCLARSNYAGERILMASDGASLALLKSDGEVISNVALPANATALVLGALGDWGAYGLADGTVTSLEIR
jgi:hypothetical protein